MTKEKSAGVPHFSRAFCARSGDFDFVDDELTTRSIPNLSHPLQHFRDSIDSPSFQAKFIARF
jgi:hypothetical protein